MKWAKEGLLNYTTTYLPLSVQLMATPSDDVSVMENKAIQQFLANVGNVILAESDEDFEAAKQEIIDGMKAFGYEDTSEEVAGYLEDAAKLAETFNFN